MEILLIDFFGKTIGSSCQLVEDKALLKSNLSAQLVSAEGNGEHRKMFPILNFISLKENQSVKLRGRWGQSPQA